MTEINTRETAEEGWVHHYVSTACLHEINDGDSDQHTRCRATCKTCDRPCECSNHTEGEISAAPPSWADQARDIARELLAKIHATFSEHEVATDVLGADLARRIATDPALFWLRGEEAEPGQWTPPEDPS